jgi:hypothetical protein
MSYMSADEEAFWEVPEHLAVIQTRKVKARAEGREMSDFRSTQFILGDDKDDTAPAAYYLEIPPLGVIPYHSHDCEVFMVVIKGSLYVPGKVLRSGDAMSARAGEWYGPEVAGPGGCSRIEFLTNQQGFLNVTFRRRDGEVFVNNALDDLPPPSSELDGMEPLDQLLAAARAEQPVRA